MKPYTCFLVLLFLNACDSVFEFSPYQANVKEAYLNQNATNIGALYLKNTTNVADSFSFITIADSHNYFKDLEDAVDKINQLDDVDFVVHLGDFANLGLLREFEIYSDILKNLNKPIITCIGNHDYLSNGEKIYEQMYGDFNFTIDYKGIHFVFFDATRFESRKRPDMNWLATNLDKETPNVILSHVPPFADQYLEEDTRRYKKIVENNRMIVSIHGHQHDFSYGSPLGTEMPFIVSGSVDRKYMCKHTIYANGSYTYSMVSF